jgi:hypothetical protein
VKRRRLKRLIEWLRSEYPTPFPVRVSLTRIPGHRIHRTDGVATRKGNALYILVDNRLTWAEMVEVVSHEWAHCVTWRHESLERLRDADHDDEWALAYGRIYRHIHDFDALQ